MTCVTDATKSVSISFQIQLWVKSKVTGQMKLTRQSSLILCTGCCQIWGNAITKMAWICAINIKLKSEVKCVQAICRQEKVLKTENKKWSINQIIYERVMVFKRSLCHQKILNSTMKNVYLKTEDKLSSFVESLQNKQKTAGVHLNTCTSNTCFSHYWPDVSSVCQVNSGFENTTEISFKDI